MADKDIVFTSEIRVDTEAAKKDIKSLATQVDSLFQKTSALMNTALKTNNFGFSAIAGNYTKGVSALNRIYNEKYKTQPDLEIPKGAKKKLRDEINAKNEEFHRWREAAYAGLVRMGGLKRHLVGLAENDTIWGDIEQLRADTAAAAVEPKQGLGRYNKLQKFGLKERAWLYSGHRLFPEVFDDDVLEYAEQELDTNRITGAQIRSNLRRLQKDEYYRKSEQRARDWLWYRDGKRLQTLNDIYGLGIKPSVKNPVARKYLDSISFGGEMEWMNAGLEAEDLRKSIKSGGMTSQELKAAREKYYSLMSKMIKGFEKAYPDQHEIALSLRKLRNEVSGAKPVNNTNTILSGLGTVISATAVAGAGMEMLESYWGESISRNVYASKLAYYNRWKIGGGLAGGVGGGILGGLVGGALSGAAAGSWSGPGALITGAVGAIGGAAYGIYKGIKAQSDIKSADVMVNRMRNQALYGSSYNSWFAEGMANVTGGDGMPELADRAMSMRGRMMLGQVSEQEMLYMSMMPNYYAALMAGITGPELMNIYKRDLDAIGDPSMKYLVGQAIGGTNAYAAANNKYFNTAYSALSPDSAYYEAKTHRFDTGFMNARIGVSQENIKKGYDEIRNTARRDDDDFYDEDAPKAKKRVTFVNVINIDGEEIKRDTKTADEVYMEDLQLYTAGV